MDIRQTKNYAQYLSKLGWKAEKIDNTYCYIKKMPIIGGFCKIQRPDNLPAGAQLLRLQKKHRLFQIVIEPKDTKQERQIRSRGYRQIKSPYLPSKTLILNLKITKKELFNKLAKNARWSINKTNSSLLFTPADLQTFHDSWKMAVNNFRWVPKLSTLKTLQQAFPHSSLFLASHNKVNEQNYDTNHISGAIFLATKDVCYYWQAFTSPLGRSLLAQYTILWKGILWGKKMGCKYFDFEGVFDHRFPQKSWQGFSAFKKKFGGTEKSYPGAFAKFFLPFF